MIFVNSYEGDKALIGTTDIAHDGAAEDVQADESEIAYLLAAVTPYFKEQLTRDDVVQTFSGVRADPECFRRQDHHVPGAGRARHPEV